MKRIILLLICALSLANVSAQTAKEILDKAASVGRHGQFRDEWQIW